MMMIPAALAGMFSKRIVVPLVRVLGYRRVLVGNRVLVGLAMASFALVQPGLPVWVHIVQFACFGAVNSLQFTAMNTLALRDLDGELASSGNSLLSMVMMLAMSLGVAVAGGLLGAFGGGTVRPQSLETLNPFRWSFVCIGLVTLTSAAIFAQLNPRTLFRGRRFKKLIRPDLSGSFRLGSDHVVHESGASPSMDRSARTGRDRAGPCCD